MFDNLFFSLVLKFPKGTDYSEAVQELNLKTESLVTPEGETIFFLGEKEDLLGFGMKIPAKFSPYVRLIVSSPDPIHDCSMSSVKFGVFVDEDKNEPKPIMTQNLMKDYVVLCPTEEDRHIIFLTVIAIKFNDGDQINTEQGDARKFVFEVGNDDDEGIILCYCLRLYKKKVDWRQKVNLDEKIKELFPTKS